MQLGKTIRRLRQDNALSQAVLGAMISIPQTTISDWENNKYLPDVIQAAALAKALNVSLTELLEQAIK